ncbi:MAG: glycosyltransferase family 4 protein [Actinomycetota bacterium]|nr:glycosyltransferase family 4 protein [Actinomycetota bacterium]
MADLFSALVAAGGEPSALVLGPATSAPPGVHACSGPHRPLPGRLWTYARRANQLASSDIQVLDAHFALYAFLPVVLGPLRRWPLVVHFQGPWADESMSAGDASRIRRAIKRFIEIAVYRRASKIIVLSGAFKRMLVEGYGIPPWTIEVIPPGIDLSRFVPGNKQAARLKLDLPADRRVVVTVRRLVPRMGLDVLIQAWALARPYVNDATLLIVGDGPERLPLRLLVDELDGGESIRFLGRVDDETLQRSYHAADLSVIPSLDLEGFGLVALESLASGTPVLATDSGGLPEALSALDPTLIVPAGDAAALSSKLCQVLTDRQVLPTASRCRSHAASYSWDSVAKRNQAAYDGAVHPGLRQLRIVYLDHCGRLSGGELALLRLLPSLPVQAHVILAEEGPLVGHLQAAGISVEVVPIGDNAGSLARQKVRPAGLPLVATIESAIYVARMVRRLRQLRPDIVHTNSLKAALYGGVAARLAGVPVIWHAHDRIAADYLPRAACHLIRVAARVLPLAIIANSETTAATLGKARRNTVVIPCALGFAPRHMPAHIQSHPLRVGIVGRLDPWKGQHVFLDAFARAFPDGDEQAVVVGAPIFASDGYEEALRLQVAALGLTGRVDFRGFRQDPEDELRRLDILVHASTIPEPFGQVVIEGLAAGLPVVAADAGGPAEVIEHGTNGLLYPPGDTEALARALKLLASNRPLRERLGSAGEIEALHFTPDQIGPRVMAVYQRVKPAGHHPS